MSVLNDKSSITTETILERKKRGEKIAVLTAYDYFIATLLDRAGVDCLLVGDSVGNVVHGFDSTIPVTMDLMVAHTAAVARSRPKALVIADMPFLSFQPSIETAVLNAGRFLQEGGAEAVKIEGGLEMLETVRRVVECGIPVMGHIGLTPQSMNKFGRPKVQGRTEQSRKYLLESAAALEQAGCFSIVLELVDNAVAAEITRSLKKTATIGIGAGPDCDGQVLVINDILGLREPEFRPKFLREYAQLTPIISEAASQFVRDVRSGNYPGEDESYGSK